MKRIQVKLFACLCLGAAALAAAPAPDEAALQRRIGYADYYVREFEKEVALQRGGEKMVWRNQRTALEKVRELKVEYPDDPRVDALFRRVRSALKRSKGDFVDIQAEWTQYLHNEDNLRQLISKLGEEEWSRIIESHREGMIAKAFPAPDSAEVPVEDLIGKYVLLEDVEYPAKQFYGASGEFIWCGKPSSGFWFIDLAGRDWLGPYEAAKRSCAASCWRYSRFCLPATWGAGRCSGSAGWGRLSPSLLPFSRCLPCRPTGRRQEAPRRRCPFLTRPDPPSWGRRTPLTGWRCCSTTAAPIAVRFTASWTRRWSISTERSVLSFVRLR